MHILGLTGPINHGKTTIAKMLISSEPESQVIESWQIIAEVAMALNKKFDPDIVRPGDLSSINSWIYHLLEILPSTINVRPAFDQIEIRDHEVDAHPDQFRKLFIYIDRLRDDTSMAFETIETSNHEEHRPILQWLGGYIPRCLGDTIWFDEIARRIKEAGDHHNLFIVSGLRYPSDAKVIHSIGGKIVEIRRPNYDEKDLSDPTEATRNQISADAQIINNGSLDELENAAKALLQDIKDGRIRREYKAVN